MRGPTFPFLYGITDSKLMPGALLERKAEAALRAGLKVLQYRDKSENSEKRLREAKGLLALCQKYSAIFIVNDDVELALACGAHGVHLGQQDEAIENARDTLGPRALIGATCHNSIHLATRAVAEGASYIAFGRFFSSQTKSDASRAELKVLTLARQRFNVPLVAIGGITENNAPQIWKAGADSAAICHALFSHDNPASTIKNFQASYRI